MIYLDRSNHTSRRYNDKAFIFIVSALYTILLFSVFIHLHFSVGHNGLVLGGDGVKQINALFASAGTNISTLTGVDTFTFNGATQMYLRPNMPTCYVPFLFFSYLGQYISSDLSIVLLYALHMFVFLYFAQLLAREFFNLDRRFSVLFACVASIAPIMQRWYGSYFFISCLTMPLFYFSLKTIRERNIGKIFLYTIAYVLGFTSGYLPLSVTLCAVTFLFSLVYLFNFEPKSLRKQALPRMFAVALVAGLVVFLYYYQMFIYNKVIVNNESADAVQNTFYYVLNFHSLASFFTTAICSNEVYENIYAISVGLVWAFLFILALSSGMLKKLPKGKRVFLYTIFVVFSLAVLGCSGLNLPFQTWLYALVPFVGSMHIVARYMMVIMPYFILASAYLIAHFWEHDGFVSLGQRPGARYITPAIVAAIALDFILGSSNQVFVQNRLLIDLSAVLLVWLLAKGKSTLTWAACFVIIIGTISNPLMISLYADVTNADQFNLTSTAVVYDEGALHTMDNFMNTLSEKELYHYVATDAGEDVPSYNLGNLGWYELLDHKISNYMGYEYHLCEPADYAQSFPWFTRFDWEYIANTRGDFAILPKQTYDVSTAETSQWIDYANESPAYILEGTYQIYPLLKYVPAHYNDGQLLLDDNPDSLDNGYFYSPDLNQSDLLSFATDDALNFNATVNVTSPTELAFLLYANPHYEYLVDGQVITPDIDGMLAYIPLNETGVHTVSVHYNNPINNISLHIFAGYYALWAVTALLLALFFVGRKLKNRKG